MNGKSGKRRMSILPSPVLEALIAILRTMTEDMSSKVMCRLIPIKCLSDNDHRADQCLNKLPTYILRNVLH